MPSSFLGMKEKKRCAAGESWVGVDFGGTLQALPSGVQGQILWIFVLFCILNSSKHKEHIVGLVHERSFVYF